MSKPENKETSMARLKGKQILLIVGQKNYNEEEFQYLRETFERQGARVFVASNRMEKALGRLEGYVTPDLAIADIRPEDFEAVVLVGGYGARVYFWDDETLHQKLRGFHQHHKVVAAASTAPMALANAGILEGKNATAFPDYDSSKLLQLKGVKVIHDHIVEDDNIITSAHPKFVKEFAEAVSKKLEEVPHGEKAG